LIGQLQVLKLIKGVSYIQRMGVWCIVLECPECGKQRPYPISESIKSVEDIGKRRPSLLKIRLLMGFEYHYVYCRGEAPSEEMKEEVIKKAKLMYVPRRIISDVETRVKQAKWDYYGL